LTQVIAEKEKKSSSYREGKLDALSEEKVSKIKKFAKEYIAKILRKLEKSGKHDGPSSSSIQATPSTSMATPNSADGDVVMDVPPMSVEEAMDMNPDSASEGEEDEEEEEEDEGRNGAVTPAESSWISGRLTPTHQPPSDLFIAPMDVVEVTQPVDPRRRPSLDGLSR